MHTESDMYQALPFPRIRFGAIDLLRKAQQMHIIHGLMEIDVTQAREFIREHKSRTGEALSFTAFIATCLAHAVNENKMTHAYRDWRNRLILFDEVDVNTMIEREAGGTKIGTPYIVRAANKKSFIRIHQEIRRAQATAADQSELKAMRWYLQLPGFVRGFLWWLLGKSPRLWKKYGGTVGITAVGMFGKGFGWGIPLSCNTLTLTLGGIVEKPGVVDGRIEVREFLCATISFDHDIVDGAPAARFAARFKELVTSGYGLGDLTEKCTDNCSARVPCVPAGAERMTCGSRIETKISKT